MRRRVGRRTQARAWARDVLPYVVLTLRSMWTGETERVRCRVIPLGDGVWGMLP